MDAQQQDLVKELSRKVSELYADAADFHAKWERALEEANEIETALGVIERYMGLRSASATRSAPRKVAPEGETTAVKVAQGGLGLEDNDLSIGDAAVEVLKAANGKWMKNRAIAEAMLKAGFEYDKDIKKLRNAVGVAMLRKTEAGEDGVQKMAPGTYAIGAEEKSTPEPDGTDSGAEGTPVPDMGG